MKPQWLTYELFINCKHFESKVMTTLFLYIPQVPIIISYMYSSLIQLTLSFSSRSSLMSIDFKDHQASKNEVLAMNSRIFHFYIEADI